MLYIQEDVESPVANAGGRSSSALNSPYPAVSNRDICGPVSFTKQRAAKLGALSDRDFS